MRPRKIVKIKIDMYEDIKLKIIDTRPERDLIQHIWSRLVNLAGKVNQEGDLYMSKNMPYTIETLAIEFNRDCRQIKLALDTFIELEMIELNEVNVYRVTNFAKHQNIKVQEKIKSKDEEVKNKEIVVKEDLKKEIYDNEDKGFENTIGQNKVEVVKIEDIGNLETTSSSINKVDKTVKDKPNNKLQEKIPIGLETKKNMMMDKKKKKEKIYDFTDEKDEKDVKGNDMVDFQDYDENKSLGKGETLVSRFVVF
ncbi:phage replisome organizer N-terminal domain-containing protein [Clostridium vincentii]|uniref:Phage replisome organiser N-terminal domain-containing protein n=1 Tax=Clostridium vincentii TaxID=52704 RepID=A0A2T0BJU7_9CLOT|nr:phage replisome organizer N-terminal domain-containing protein [Clostridium vincentii]PRR84166.1 hypothetical protein CLVI_04640 [Clostridium vincentii]